MFCFFDTYKKLRCNEISSSNTTFMSKTIKPIVMCFKKHHHSNPHLFLNRFDFQTSIYNFGKKQCHGKANSNCLLKWWNSTSFFYSACCRKSDSNISRPFLLFVSEYTMIRICFGSHISDDHPLTTSLFCLIIFFTISFTNRDFSFKVWFMIRVRLNTGCYLFETVTSLKSCAVPVALPLFHIRRVFRYQSKHQPYMRFIKLSYSRIYVLTVLILTRTSEEDLDYPIVWSI